MRYLTAAANIVRVSEVRNRLLVTIFWLIVYKVAAAIPVPGITPAMVEAARNSEVAGTTAFQALNIMAGGALANLSIVALSVYPYLAAFELFDNLSNIIPRLHAMMREPGSTEKRVAWAAFLTVPLALFAAFIGEDLALPLLDVERAGFLDGLTVVCVLTAGTFLSLWIARQIDRNGLGNGISLIIFTNIVGELPTFFASADEWGLAKTALIILVLVLLIAIMVRMSEAVRRIPTQYGRRVRGRSRFGGGTSIPIAIVPPHLNTLESSYGILVLSNLILLYFQQNHNSPLINDASVLFLNVWPVVLFLLVLISSFRGMPALVAERDLAGNLQRNGGFIPGVRPGTRTQQYIVQVAGRLAWITAPYLAILSVLPWLLQGVFGLAQPVYLVPVLWVSTRIVIDWARELQARLVLHNYFPFLT